MLTETMTHAEVYRELDRDRDTATTWWRHTVGSVWRTASKLGLKKSPEFLAQWGHLVASTEGARANQFAKGQSPAI